MLPQENFGFLHAQRSILVHFKSIAYEKIQNIAQNCMHKTDKSLNQHNTLPQPCNPSPVCDLSCMGGSAPPLPPTPPTFDWGGGGQLLPQPPGSYASDVES